VTLVSCPACPWRNQTLGHPRNVAQHARVRHGLQVNWSEAQGRWVAVHEILAVLKRASINDKEAARELGLSQHQVRNRRVAAHVPDYRERAQRETLRSVGVHSFHFVPGVPS